MRKPYLFILTTILCILFSRSPAMAGETSALELILRAQGRGELDQETAFVYRIWASLDPHRLPPQFAAGSREFLKSLTPLLLEVRTRWDQLSPRARSQLAPYLLRPTEPGQEPYFYGHSYEVPAVFYDSPGGHFRIWYVTSTDDSPSLIYTHGDSVPDWIHLCGQVFDQVWETEVDSLGFTPPPADGPWYGQEDYGGDSRYDVYVENLDRHYVYGYTQSEFFVTDGAPRAATSYIVVDNDYASGIYPTRLGSGLMVTAAHEFFHAVQFAYDTLEDRYFMEISSTWMEDVVYDAINDYYYYLDHSKSIFSRPDSSLTTFDGLHEYSSCVWGHYLSKRFGLATMREIWEGCVQAASLEATRLVLEAKGRDLASALNEFAVWNYFTGPRADTVNFYPEGDRYPTVKVYLDNVHSDYPVSVSSLSHPPRPLGASYVQFVPTGAPGGLRVEINGGPEVVWKAALVGAGENGEVAQIPIDGFGHGLGQLPDWNSYQQMGLVVTPFALSGPVAQYTYQATPDSGLIEPGPLATSLGQNYPNPVDRERTVIPFTVAGDAQVTLRIFTLDGRLVRRFDYGSLSTGQFFGPDLQTGGWDLTNGSGEPVAAGIYLYQLQAGDYVETRKMVVVR